MADDALDELLWFNGIDGTTGDYGLPPMTTRALGSLVSGRRPQPRGDTQSDADPDFEQLALQARVKRDESSPEALAELRRQRDAVQEQLSRALARGVGGREVDALKREVERFRGQLAEREHLGVKEGIDPLDLTQAGWGVILPAVSDPEAARAVAEIREALQELLQLRKAQAGRYFRSFEGPAGYRPNETKTEFLLRHGADPAGPADPEKIPYYLLLVGSPAEIPYSFQYQLDVQYAVGRIWFPRAQQYADYARSLIEAERGAARRERTLVLFGAQSPDDAATELSTRLLVRPLHEQLQPKYPGWNVRAVVEGDATRARLERLLGGDETPALLFTASHGLELPSGHARQLAHQGALVCSDWPGPAQWKGRGELPEGCFFAGDHLAASADVAGMVVFGFACHGAGTPLHDEFADMQAEQEPRRLAEQPFVSSLPQALLGRPGGALAFVGHVDRAWPCSFTAGGRNKSYTTTFQSTLERLLGQQPVGHALDYFHARHAEVATVLADVLGDRWRVPNLQLLAWLWTTRNDARGYVLIGDPAARLSFVGDAPRRQVGDGVVPEPAGGPTMLTVASEAVIERPPELDAADWARTPESVQRYIDGLRRR